MTECVFCEIVAGARPASLVYQDTIALAFMDIRPITPGHLLVIPRRHAASLAELDEETAAHLLKVGQRLAAGLRASGIRCEGVNLFLADGEAAGQDVFHVHLHVFPRFPGDGLLITGEWQSPQRAALDQAAASIRAALGA